LAAELLSGANFRLPLDAVKDSSRPKTDRSLQQGLDLGDAIGIRRLIPTTEA
jgi:hypothetical protein